MKRIAIYSDAYEKLFYIDNLSICFKKAMISSAFELNLVDANGMNLDTIHFEQLKEYRIGEEEYRILMIEMDKMVRENAKFLYDEYGKKEVIK